MASSSAFLSRKLSSLSNFAQAGAIRANAEAGCSSVQSRVSMRCGMRHPAAARLSGLVGSNNFNNDSVQTTDLVSSGTARRSLRGGRVKATEETEGVTEAEKAGWEKRMEESKEAGTETPAFGEWKWTLNWNFITPDIAIGSCPRSASDVDRIVDEGGFNAIINLQSDLCFDALEIPIDAIRSRAIERGVLLRRVPVRDFDHNDQALMLPEAVRALNLLVERGKKVYVHCTAGINRASLTVVGYLTFVQGMSLEEATMVVKNCRPVAHPYIDCWQVVRHRLLEGREEQLTGMSRQIYDDRCVVGAHGNMKSDWTNAQIRLIADTFRRYLEVDTLAYELERDIMARSLADQEPATAAEEASTSGEIGAEKNGAENGAAHADAWDEEEAPEDADALECNVITRECVKADASEVDEWESSLSRGEDQPVESAGAVK
ncbi:Dual specificity protein phosphatase family protein [Klebsormidium nitens]|uniref:Dual specificity protein phosphatase family protein n=1 Tax=Klebsormidium nitens TaxID=105231 RepID=A0A1Y1HWW1_KLENI|nr:Dual specificity protein phosphatase family protein [Klebsormidium nitens]|eukprot:GAQ81461.1 Dual specificity protein phosphatase family protein [Klebsormidium nitens]